MIIFTLTRTAKTDTYTEGQLSTIQGYLADTLERAVNDPEHPAIPEGVYVGTMYDSPEFGRPIPLLENVPGRDHIEIHPANYPSELKGCIAPGRKAADGVIDTSRETSDAINKMIIDNGGDFQILIQSV